MAQVLEEFVALLGGGIEQLATSIAQGVSHMASALFLETSEQGAVSGLSVYGGIVAIFAGVALAIAITTRVFTWITSLGN